MKFKVSQMFKLVGNDFIVFVINLFSDIRENMFVMNKKIGNFSI